MNQQTETINQVQPFPIYNFIVYPRQYVDENDKITQQKLNYILNQSDSDDDSSDSSSDSSDISTDSDSSYYPSDFSTDEEEYYYT